MLELDIQWLFEVGTQPAWMIAWTLFSKGGWVVFLWLGAWLAKEMWMEHIHHLTEHHRRFVLLQVNIPKMNEQSPKAVENIFAHLHGTLSGPNLVEKYWLGKTQERFSLEIVSIAGYIRFLIRANVVFRDLIEAAFYAQYPEAEIMEVPDYTDDAPSYFPHPTYTMWGTEFILARPEAYPIRSYIHFEHQLSQEFKDPLAALLETLSRLQEGEQAWLQFVITPEGSGWQEESEHIVKKIGGIPVEHKETFIQKVLGGMEWVVLAVVDMFTAPAEVEYGRNKERGARSEVPFLTPGERVVLEGIQMKATKLGFRTKFRLIYLATHEVFSKARGVAPVVGAIKQFNTNDMNSFKGAKDVVTDVDYFFKKTIIAHRQNKLMRAYKERGNEVGHGEGVVLNAEELATVFHFPVVTVKAPLLMKTQSKRAEPPFTLPTVAREQMERKQKQGSREQGTGSREPEEIQVTGSGGAPANLPIVS